jgi:2-keto-3-deoxy-L-rhamnonate aldolase RhmA
VTDLRFRERVAGGDTLIGTMLTLPSPAVAEILADAGFDWLFLDAEHGPLAVGDLLAIIRAVDSIPCVVRVERADEVAIKRVLDIGAAGVIVPQVNSAETAAAVVRHARYAPEGARGVGLARAHRYGFGFADYLASANAATAVIVQAEHADAIENIEAIVAVPGVDAVLLGPYDLSASLGRMGDIEHPVVQQAIDHVTSVCRQAGMPLGYFGISAAAVRPFIDRGYTLIVAGVDTLLLGSGARQLREAL